MHPHLDEQDLALLHALQIAPRISWAEAARVLGTTATTLATRWYRLRSEGAAWITVHPGRRLTDVTVAFIDIDVAPAEREEAIRALCRDPRAVTIEEAASGRDLMVTTFASDQDSLARFAVDDLPRLPGVRRINTRVATRIHREGSQWRLDALDRYQQSTLTSGRGRKQGADPPLPPKDCWALVEALTRDGRRSAADLARVTGRNPATVRRQLARLVSSGTVSFRCEIARPRSRPVMCTWFARVPQQDLEQAVRSLMTLPDLRLCTSVTGDTNLMFSMWTSSASELLSLERRMGEKLPSMTLAESVLELRTPKRMGWILDPAGHSTGDVVVPLPAHASQRNGA